MNLGHVEVIDKEGRMTVLYGQAVAAVDVLMQGIKRQQAENASLREALKDLHDDIQGRIDDGDKPNPGTLAALELARKALEER